MDYKNFFVNYSKDLSKLLANVDTDLINKTVELDATPQILGMVKKVAHLVQTEEI